MVEEAFFPGPIDSLCSRFSYGPKWPEYLFIKDTNSIRSFPLFCSQQFHDVTLPKQFRIMCNGTPWTSIILGCHSACGGVERESLYSARKIVDSIETLATINFAICASQLVGDPKQFQLDISRTSRYRLMSSAWDVTPFDVVNHLVTQRWHNVFSAPIDYAGLSLSSSNISISSSTPPCSAHSTNKFGTS